MKRLALILVLLCAVCVLGVVPVARADDPTSFVTTEIVIPAPDAEGPTYLKITVQMDAPPRARFRMEFPNLIDGDGVNGFNTAINGLITESFSAFSQSLAENDTNIPLTDVSSGSFFQLTTENLYWAADLLSVKLTFGYYYAGAAHPSSFSRTLTYSQTLDKALALSDLFIAKSDYLQQIAAFCQNDLKAQDFLVFPDGAEPKAENYRSWNLTGEGLQINFDDYQVAPHAVGPLTVVIPYFDLAQMGIVDPEGPIGTFVQ
ncbi:MAG TPA: RsiV family protein [Aggregatilineales bacterium]|nr:DUF3298 domain-containing protein [Anaerolineales bacterium]HRE46394.1 RsiV family protein [Aggregatilineales bacterium]